MTRPVTKTKIMEDGLRYRAKVSGSPFNVPSSNITGTMSCFLCGTHRNRSTMTTRKLIGRAQVVCAPSCSAAKQADQIASTSLSMDKKVAKCV